MNWHSQKRLRLSIRWLILGTIVFAFALPIIWTLAASIGIRPTGVRLEWLVHPNLAAYLDLGIAEPGFWHTLLNSLLIAFSASLLSMVIAFFAAYSLSHSGLSRQPFLQFGLLLLASLPVIAYIIPLTELLRYLHLRDTYLGLVMVQTSMMLPLAAFMLSGYLSQLQPELEEAAHLEGASLGYRIWHIVIPYLAPGLIAITLIIFILDWNSLLAPLVLGAGHIRTLPLALVDFFTFERELEWPTAAAAVMISFVPLSLSVSLGYRFLARFVMGQTKV